MNFCAHLKFREACCAGEIEQRSLRTLRRAVKVWPLPESWRSASALVGKRASPRRSKKYVRHWLLLADEHRRASRSSQFGLLTTVAYKFGNRLRITRSKAASQLPAHSSVAEGQFGLIAKSRTWKRRTNCQGQRGVYFVPASLDYMRVLERICAV